MKLVAPTGFSCVALYVWRNLLRSMDLYVCHSAEMQRFCKPFPRLRGCALPEGAFQGMEKFRLSQSLLIIRVPHFVNFVNKSDSLAALFLYAVSKFLSLSETGTCYTDKNDIVIMLCVTVMKRKFCLCCVGRCSTSNTSHCDRLALYSACVLVSLSDQRIVSGKICKKALTYLQYCDIVRSECRIVRFTVLCNLFTRHMRRLFQRTNF